MTAPTTTSPLRPDLRTLLVAIGAAVVSYGVAVTLLIATRTDSATAGVAQYLVSGLAPAVAVGIAFLVGARDPAALGLRRIPPRWILVSVACGIGAVALTIAVTVVTVVLTGPPSDLQRDYGAAASGGPLLLALTLLAGAVLTPIGEELLFRGVIANWLMRFGAWIAVPLSAMVFALAHGIDYVLPVAFVIGVVAALLLRATGSIWPGVIVHAVNNGYAIVAAAVVAGSAG